jgi:hypothetical protein
MADIVTLTQQPIRIGTAQKQAIYLSSDVGGYDIIDWELIVVALEGSATPSITLRLITGMQPQTDDGWIQCVQFNAGSPISVSNSSFVASSGPTTSNPLLRYVRWEATAFAGTTPFATFWIRGMARKLSA